MCVFAFYKVCKAIYVALWYYFVPFFIVFLSYAVPLVVKYSDTDANEAA